MKIYEGISHGDATRHHVYVRTDLESNRLQALNPRLDLRNHSPSGLSWGYGGSGPAQLSLALIADATGDDELALEVYQDFKWALIQHLPQDGSWVLSDTVIQVMARKFAKAALERT